MLDNNVEYELDNPTRAKMAAKKRGSNNPNFGKPRDEETKRKISQAQTQRHAQIKAFNEASTMSATKQVWEKVRFSGFNILNLSQFYDTAALYEMTSLKDMQVVGYRVIYYFNDVEKTADFTDEQTAAAFYDTMCNPDVVVICTENKRSVYVLGLLKGINLSHAQDRKES